MRHPPFGIILGIILGIALGSESARRPRVVPLPMPTSETIPYVAEVMGAASYSETLEDEELIASKTSSTAETPSTTSGNRRVQRKLNIPNEGDKELDSEYQEYQGNKTRVVGRPGVDFPVLQHIPRTEFSCRKVKKSGYYADLETGCQVFHICDGGRKISFLCPNGTIFRQSHLICDWWFRVDCERSVEQYDESAEQLAHDQMVYKKRAEEIARAMKTVSTTETSPIGWESRRGQNERRVEKLVEASTVNQRSGSNQIAENDNRGDSSRSNSALNFYPNNNPVASALKQSPPSPESFKPSTEPANEQKTTQFILQITTPSSTDVQPSYQENSSNNNYGDKIESPNQNLNVPVASQNYQLPSDNFNNVGSPLNYQTSGAGNTNYKFSYTVNTPSQTRPTASRTKQDFTNNQVFSHQTAPQEKEQQIPAETASFASNRHRFGNQIDPNYYQNTYVATPSTTSTENYQTSNLGKVDYNTGSGASTSYASQATDPSTKFQKRKTTTPSPYTQNVNTGPSTLNTFAQTNQNEFGVKNPNLSKVTANLDDSKTGRKIQNSFFQQYSPNVAQFGRPRPTFRGSINHLSAINMMTSLPTSITAPSSSQVYNSHMQPYASINQNGNQMPTGYFVNTQGTFSTWHPSQASAASTLPTFSNSQESKNSPNNFTPTQVRNENKPSGSSTVKPYRRKPVFNVKIRPNKDYSLLELHRQHPTNPSLMANDQVQTRGSTPSISPQYSTTGSDVPITSAQSPTSYSYTNGATASFAAAETKPPFSPTSSSVSFNSPTPAHKYATVNITGTPEEIRPEIVNSLMDSGIKPTSANALLTFASYYGSAETKDSDIDEFHTTIRPHVSDVVLNLGTTIPHDYSLSTVKAITSTNGNDLPSELSENTKDSYSYLFSDKKEQPSQKYDLTPKESGPVIPELSKSHRQFAKEFFRQQQRPAETSTVKPETTTHKLRDSAELRELAQVFSRALSAYLEDPETFKEILAQVRPTEPNPVDLTTPNPDDEVLDFSDASQSRTGTTETPVTPSITSNDVTGDISIGDINNLLHSKGRGDFDSSYETNSISPTNINSVSNIELTTQAATAFPEITSVDSAASSDYFSKLGSAEDTSYFPTAGGVSDNSRPRYGGFHNNTRKSNYSPYGAELKHTTTKNPGTIASTKTYYTTTFPPFVTTVPPVSDYTTLQPQQASSVLPGAQQVNNLFANHKALYKTSAQFTSSSEEEKDGPAAGSNEKFLLTAGSQSLVSSQNYASFAQNFNRNSLKQFGKDAFGGYASSAVVEEPSAISNDYFKSDLSPYFGQEPPFETFSQPAAFQTPIPHFGDKIAKNQSASSDFNTQASVNNYNYQSQNSYVPKENQFIGVHVMSDRMGYDETAAGTDNTVSPGVTWTASPYETTQFVSSSSKIEVSPALSSTTVIKPTTYHPLHSSPEPTTTADPVQFETTTVFSQDASTTTEPATYQTTVQPELLTSDSNTMQVKANEMFGMLNETASTMLMHVMSMAENNMTIRRLVLLLVNDPNKQKTDEQSRMSLINALLTHENEIEDYTTVAPPTKLKASKPSRPQSNSRSLKPQREIDNKTNNHGTNNVRNATEHLNKANAAKLYIPLGPSVASTDQNLTPERLQTSTTTIVSSSSSVSTATTLPATTTLPYDSDARALELLKTLYSLAAKWG